METKQVSGEVKISVRNLVEFILRDGDIDNRRQGGSDTAMQEGNRIHKKIQKSMGGNYRAEVPLQYKIDCGEYKLLVEGRADGIMDTKEELLIDEIKGTYRDLNKMREPVPVHIAQARCYAYMYATENNRDKVRVRMTYCNMDTEDIRYFYEDCLYEDLHKWFQGLISEYRKWSDYSWEWGKIRQASLEKLEFPFPYREGQKELVSYAYQTIYHKRKLFLEAPTGVGKTISTVFPALKAMSKNMGEKLFYLTAKTITRTVADNTFTLLRENGLHFKSVTLTAKEKVCFQEQTECNPEMCSFAKGHFDRINAAMYDMLTHEENFSRDNMDAYARKHQVCPFEFALDMSLFADGIVCDYNYLFDPHVYLKRFFAEGNTGEYIFLIDEAHNLLERGREMYSAALVKEDFLHLKQEIKQTILSEFAEMEAKKGVAGQLTLEMTSMSGSEKMPWEMSDAELEEQFAKESTHKKGKYGHSIFVKQGYGEKIVYYLEKCNKVLLSYKRECENYCIIDEIDEFVQALMRLHGVFSDYLEEQEEEKLVIRDDLLDFYFAVSHFLEMYELLDDNYVKYTQLDEDGSFMIKLFCVNPSRNLRECMKKGRSSILFSATFLPIQYYKSLLGGEEKDYEVYAKSVFHHEKKLLLIANDVTSKYSRRSDDEYFKIARYIDEIVKSRSGNYMVFCPSYAFLQRIYDIFTSEFEHENRTSIIQQDYMSEEAREEFLSRFRGNEECDLSSVIDISIEEEENTLVAFCVLGGIFGEGIDLKYDSLIGAIIVGTGLPLVCNEREILKNYFDENGENGFDYSYCYPGMNKVLQAAGRVIRTEEDIGFVALLDERFLQYSYRRMFPREWESYEEVGINQAATKLERFWDSWSKY